MKKIILCILIVCIGFVIYNKIIDTPTEQCWTNNQVNGKIENFEEPSKYPQKSELYIDASGSMKPYFFATNTTISNSISEFVNLDKKGTDIYFIGSDKKYNGLVTQIISDVKKQPNLASTSFETFFAKASEKVAKNNSIIYLVTDGIMSINGVKNMQTALTQMEGNIRNSLRGYSNIAAAIFRYKSGYKGTYWNCHNQAIHLNKEMQRPYYIIALGKTDVIRWLSKQDGISAKDNDAYFIGIHNYTAHNKLKLDKGDSAKLGSPGQTITLAVDLPPCLQSMDVSKAVIKINKKVTNGIKLINSEGKLTAELGRSIAVPGGQVEVSIDVPNEIPQTWISTWNTDNDLHGPDSIHTFGLSSLVKGMHNALDSEKNLLSIAIKFYKK